MITTTLAAIRKARPCEYGYRILARSLGGVSKYGEDTPLDVVHIVESNSLEDVLWVKFRAHRLAFVYMTGEQPPNCVDHINCDKTDNRWANLRNASYPLNAKNMPLRKDNKSGVKGVDFHSPSNGWRARVQADGVQYNLGRFDTREQAEAAIIEARKTLHGEFGRHVGSCGGVSFANEEGKSMVRRDQSFFMVVRDGVLYPSSWPKPKTALPNGSVVRVNISWEDLP